MVHERDNQIISAQDCMASELGNSILRTFYNSFLASQGSAALQEHIMVLAAGILHAEDTFQPSHLAQAIEYAGGMTSRLQTPKSHTTSKRVQISLEFAKNWNSFVQALHVPEPYDLSTTHTRLRLALVACREISRDMNYMDTTRYDIPSDARILNHGRPSTALSADRRFSLVREHMLRRTPFKCRRIGTILLDAGAALFNEPFEPDITTPLDANTLSATRKHHLPKLVKLWEQHHPDEAFYAP